MIPGVGVFFPHSPSFNSWENLHGFETCIEAEMSQPGFCQHAVLLADLACCSNAEVKPSTSPRSNGVPSKHSQRDFGNTSTSFSVPWVPWHSTTSCMYVSAAQNVLIAQLPNCMMQPNLQLPFFTCSSLLLLLLFRFASALRGAAAALFHVEKMLVRILLAQERSIVSLSQRLSSLNSVDFR